MRHSIKSVETRCQLTHLVCVDLHMDHNVTAALTTSAWGSSHVEVPGKS